ncbi:hypothetical protein UY3_15670 [Chelonia mydas]|uniref:Uncharacterized protein n=1 Tax=Chelonia mydas TaxID=8469 RepID=M7ARH5_CHEMY|nr:hypothetical protein UY3_15670 [Chelonia mydas]
MKFGTRAGNNMSEVIPLYKAPNSYTLERSKEKLISHELLNDFEVAITEKLVHTELVQMNGTYWCVTAQNYSIKLNGKPCPSRHPSVCMMVPRRATLTVDGRWLHHTPPMMGNLTWDPEWHYGKPDCFFIVLKIQGFGSVFTYANWKVTVVPYSELNNGTNPFFATKKDYLTH